MAVHRVSWAGLWAYASLVIVLAACSGGDSEIAETTDPAPSSVSSIQEVEEAAEATEESVAAPSKKRVPLGPLALPQDPDHLGVAVVRRTSDASEFNPDPSNPAVGGAELTIDRVYSASAIRNSVANDGEKLVIVDYQVFTAPDVIASNLSSPFRLIAEGTTYEPSQAVNHLLQAGSIVNEDLVFAVPEHLTNFELEAGAPERGGGLTASYEIELQPDPTALAPLEANASVPDLEVAGSAGSIELVNGIGVMAPDVSSPAVGSGPVEIGSVTSSLSAEGAIAGPGDKLVTIEASFTLSEGAAVIVSHNSFRLEAEEELYGSMNQVAAFVQNGMTAPVSLHYRIPRTADKIVLHAGSLDDTPGGTTSSYAITLESGSDAEAAASSVGSDGLGAIVPFVDSDMPFTFDHPSVRPWQLVVDFDGQSFPADHRGVSLHYGAEPSQDNQVFTILALQAGSYADRERDLIEDQMAAQAAVNDESSLTSTTFDGKPALRVDFVRESDGRKGIGYSVEGEDWYYSFGIRVPLGSDAEAVFAQLEEVVESLAIE